MKSSRSILCLFFLLTSLIAASCSSPSTPIYTPTEARVIPSSSATLASSPSPRPTATYTVTTQPTPEPTRTLTPVPPTPAWVSYELPDWVSDRNTPVLVGYDMLTENPYPRQNSVFLWNGLTGENIELNVPNTMGYYWLPDGSALGFLSTNLKISWEIDLVTGIVTSSDVPASSVELVQTSSGHLEALQKIEFSGQDGYSFIPSWIEVSYDGRYLIENFYDDEILITDIYLKETFNLPPKYDQQSHVFYSWSPTQPYLAVLYCDELVYQFYYTDGPANWTIAVYDVAKRQLKHEYQNMFWVNWSPDGNKLLYQTPSNTVWENPICVLDRIKGESKCYKSQFDKHRSTSTDKIIIQDLRWLSDSLSFGYLYAIENENSFFGNIKGGVCIFSTDDGTQRCFLEQVEQRNGWIGENPYNVLRYWPSPDWKVLLYLTDTACVRCDYADDPRMGFVNVETGSFATIDVYMDFSHLLWRP